MYNWTIVWAYILFDSASGKSVPGDRKLGQTDLALVFVTPVARRQRRGC